MANGLGPVVFKHGSRAQYDALETKSGNALYFLEDTGEIYHGTVNLARGNHYEGTRAVKEGVAETDNEVIARVLGEHPAVKDDIFVIKTLIANDKYSYISFVYDGINWAAMDGNYNAENVYFDEDIMITTEVGNIKLSNGSANIPASGKNIKQVFEALWTKENYNPSVTNPSISLGLDKTSEEGEVGTAFTAPTATATATGFGAFQFGSKDSAGKFYAANATSDVVFSTLKVGAAATASALTADNSVSVEDIAAGDSVKSISYVGEDGTFTDNAQTQKFSATATHTGSARKGVSNLGNLVNATSNGQAADFESAGKGIAPNVGTMAKNGTAAFTATGYRAWFVGMLDVIPEVTDITSAYIREKLTNKGKVVDGTHEIKPGAAGAKCVLIAIPATKAGLTGAILTSSMNTDILEDYTKNKITVKVADASGAEGTEVDYNVYWYKPASLGSDEVHSLTVKA